MPNITSPRSTASFDRNKTKKARGKTKPETGKARRKNRKGAIGDGLSKEPDVAKSSDDGKLKKRNRT